MRHGIFFQDQRVYGLSDANVLIVDVDRRILSLFGSWKTDPMTEFFGTKIEQHKSACIHFSDSLLPEDVWPTLGPLLR